MSNRHSLPVTLRFPNRGRWFIIIMAVLFCTITGSLARSNDQKGITDSLKISPITDIRLLDWVGKWQGHCHVATDSIPIEINWKLADDGQWLRGEFKIWRDFKKSALIRNEIIFIRPDDKAGIYKGVAIGEDGSCCMGRAEIRDRVWEWTWTYDNGNQEKGELVLYTQGEITYDATVTDTSGMKVKTLDYDITRPYMVVQSKY